MVSQYCFLMFLSREGTNFAENHYYRLNQIFLSVSSIFCDQSVVVSTIEVYEN